MANANTTAVKSGKASMVDRFAYRSPSAGFTDDRIFVVSPGDERLAIYSDPAATAAHLQQAFDGPGYIAISPNVTNESLGRVSARFGIPVDDLADFRELVRKLYSLSGVVSHG